MSTLRKPIPAIAAARHCGECTLCCKLLPDPKLDTPENTRCRFLRHGKGCTVYGRRPEHCRLWDCLWLRGEDVQELRRPDRGHYIVDMMPDFITTQDAEEPEKFTDWPVVQIWIDPLYPDAHRDPYLRRWLDRRKELALIRQPGAGAFLLVPPSRNDKENGYCEYRDMTCEERDEVTRVKKLAELGYGVCVCGEM